MTQQKMNNKKQENVMPTLKKKDPGKHDDKKSPKHAVEEKHDAIQTLLTRYQGRTGYGSGLPEGIPSQHALDYQNLVGILRSHFNQIHESFKYYLREQKYSSRKALHEAIKNPYAADENNKYGPSYTSRNIEEDPVLAYCLAHEAGLMNLRDSFLEDAVEFYAKQWDLYDAVMEKDIPSELRKAASSPIAQRCYMAGTHVTAIDDLPVLLRHAKKESFRLPTGLDSLDDALGGGLSGLTIVGADEGKGKTSLLLSIVVAALRKLPHLDCLFLTLDQPKSATLWKMISHVTGCDLKTLRQDIDRQPVEVKRRIDDGFAELKNNLLSRIRFLEKPNLPQEPLACDWLVNRYKELRKKSNAKQGLLIVDMFQSVNVFPKSVNLDNDRDDYRLKLIQDFSKQTKSKTCPNGFPVLISSEVRKTEKKELTANDLRGSARLGSIPDNIVLLWPTENTNQYTDIVPRTALISKTRLGENGFLHLNFHHAICRFEESGPPSNTVRESVLNKPETVNKLDRSKDL